MSVKKQEVNFTRRELKKALKRTSYIDEIRWMLGDDEGNIPSRSSIERKMGSGKWPSLARKYRLTYGSPSTYFNSLKFGKSGVSIFIPNSLLLAGGYEVGDKLKFDICGNHIKFINNIEQEDTVPIVLPNTDINPNTSFKARCPEEEIECDGCHKLFKISELNEAVCREGSILTIWEKDGEVCMQCDECHDCWRKCHC